MTTFIKPTPGRIVYYWPGPSETIPHIPGQPLSAQVASIQEDETLTLSVLDSCGSHHPRNAVPLIQPLNPAPDDRSYAYWMPYQIGKAAQTDQAKPDTAEPAPAEEAPSAA